MLTIVPHLLLITSLLYQTDAPRLDEKQLTRILEPYFQNQAETYEFFLDKEQQQPLELVKKPVMRWTSEGNLGAVWVWTREGRAELIGCLGAFVNGQGKLEAFHEFHSLTMKPLQPVKIGAIREWQSQKPGVAPTLIRDAPDPAPTDKLRLAQMRELARQFTAHFRAGEKSELLRMSPTPLFRSTANSSDVIDGALFSYLRDNGTDPEVLLFIEARKTASGSQWYFAPVRFTWNEVSLKYQDKEVWRVPQHDEFWRSQVLRDNYVTCAMGLLDIEAIRAAREETP